MTVEATEQRLVIREFRNGMTVRELKEMLKDWPEADQYGEGLEVWVETGKCLTAPVKTASPLNLRRDERGNVSADILLESGAFDE